MGSEHPSKDVLSFEYAVYLLCYQCMGNIVWMTVPFQLQHRTSRICIVLPHHFGQIDEDGVPT